METPMETLTETPMQVQTSTTALHRWSVMLIEWHGEAARRRGIGKILVQRWKATRPEYKRIVLE